MNRIASNTWMVEDGQNAVYGSTPTDPSFKLFGKTKDAPSCQAACHTACGIYTRHDANQGSYANDCIFRLDGVWTLTAQSGHTSGYLPSRIHAGRNTYVINIKGQVPDVPGLQINGERATRARYPNLPGGIEVSPGCDGTISGSHAKWTPPDLNKYGLVKFYTDNSSAHHRNDTTGTWFQVGFLSQPALPFVVLLARPVKQCCCNVGSITATSILRTPSLPVCCRST